MSLRRSYFVSPYSHYLHSIDVIDIFVGISTHEIQGKFSENFNVKEPPLLEE